MQIFRAKNGPNQGLIPHQPLAPTDILESALEKTMAIRHEYTMNMHAFYALKPWETES